MQHRTCMPFAVILTLVVGLGLPAAAQQNAEQEARQAGESVVQQKGAFSSEMKTKEVRINGVTLHYIERRQGTPVVLVHGTLGDYRRADRFYGREYLFKKGDQCASVVYGCSCLPCL